ncbi:MAG: hypothetical protein KatS3mg111_2618 [Pirellulaceae bacterium]|nr:MAG: hypothetical protein KatS3mg111_2618 [Pirellulaceae bacterium]
MQPHHQALWQRVERFDLDPPTRSLRLSTRLARENGWSLPFARRVLGEYKRFLFLSAVASHPVCPSEQVDQAWHLHLTYTRFWESLCNDVLGRPLHHDATRGGQSERLRHEELYRSTLESYRRFFGTPPEDIWPPLEERFEHRAQWCRIDRAKYWLVPRPRWAMKRLLHVLAPQRRRRGNSRWTALLLVPIIAVSNPFNFSGPAFLVFFLAMYFIALLGGLIVRRMLLPEMRDVTAIELNPYEIACLNHGPRVVIHAAIARLVHDDLLTQKHEAGQEADEPTQADVRLVVAQPLPDSALPLERAIYRRTAEAGEEGMLIDELQDAVLPEAADIEVRLQELGLLNRGDDMLARWIPASMMAALLLVGVGKIAIGLHRDRPVVLLVVACLIVLITGMSFLHKRRLSRAGERVLRRYRGLAPPLVEAVRKHRATGEDLAMALALTGGAALAGTSLAALWPAGNSSRTNSGWWSGCGTGCGGGGCGGGGCGGGCGGCGGD